MRGIVVLGCVLSVFLLSTISLTDAIAQTANTCGINFVSGNSVTYGSLQSGATSSEQIITLSNPGTVAATLSANGTNWTDGTQTSTTTFTDNFASYADTTAGDLAYPTTDTVRGRVNPITDVIDLSLSASNQLDEIHHDFGAGVISDTSWVLRFKLDIAEFTKATVVGNEHKVVFQLASGLGTSEIPTDDAIGLNVKMSNAELGYYGYKNDAGSQTTIDTTYDPTVHTIFVELTRSSATTGTAKLFSDSGYSVQLGSTANLAPEATITGLRYFKVHLFTQSTNGQLIGTVDDVQFWNGVSQVPNSGGQTNIMNVGNTKFSNSSGTYSAKTPLGITLQNIDTLQPSVNTNTYWQLQANLLSSSFTGNLTQTMNFRVSCDGSSGGSPTVSYPDGLGSAADATVTGNPSITVAGKLGSYATTGVDGAYFTMPNSNTNLGFLSNGDYSLSFWIKKGIGDVILSSTPGAGGWYGVSYYLTSDGTFYASRGGSGHGTGGESWNKSTGIADSNWHFVTVTGTATPSQSKLYVDGTELTSLTYTYTSALGNADHQSNLTLFGYGDFSGGVGTYSESTHTLDEFSVWNRILTQSEVSQLYNSGTGNKPSVLSNLSGLKAYYDFEQQSPWLPVSFNTSTIVSGMSANGNVLSASGITGSWASYIRSNEYINPAQGGGEFYATGHSHPPNFAFGFEKSPFNQYPSGTYQNANYGFHTTTLAAGNHIYEKTTLYNANVGSTSDSQTWKITMDKNGLVKYYVDSILVRTSSVTATNDNYYIDASFSGSGSDTASFYYRPNPVLINQAVPPPGGSPPSTATFTDDFTSYTTQAAADAVWIPASSKIKVNLFTDKLDADTERSTTSYVAYHDYGSSIDTSWVTRFKWEIPTRSVSGNDLFYVGWSANTGNQDADTAYTNGNFMGMLINFRSINEPPAHGQIAVAKGSTHAFNLSYNQMSTQLSDGGTAYTRWFELINNAGILTLNMYSDEYVTLIESKQATNTASVNDLRYFKLFNEGGGFVTGVVTQIDDVQFWNGVSQVPP